jgi:bifunctional non-homologous end joining protein LigD
MTDRIPFRIRPMLATLVREPVHRSGWIYEEKYDGYRLLAYKEGGRVRLLSRNGNDRTDSYSRLAAVVADLDPATLVLDGEAVAFDRHRVSRFQLLQQGAGRVRFAVFDCLYVAGRDLRSNPLSERRQLLESVVGGRPPLLLARRLAANGLTAYREAKRRGYEGVVAKDAASRYVSGRSTNWLKVKVRQEDEFLIIGYTPPRGSRTAFGALLLGAHDHGRMRYVGKVGAGFDRRTLATLLERLRPLARTTPPAEEAPRERGVTYVTPRLIAQVAFEEWTADGNVRQPVYLGLRDDKRPADVVVPRAPGVDGS